MTFSQYPYPEEYRPNWGRYYTDELEILDDKIIRAGEKMLSDKRQNAVDKTQEMYAETVRRRKAETEAPDMVNHPPHYNVHPSGVETIQITEHFNFCRGNVIKYVWRADEKGGLEDLKKARWYLDREIARLEGMNALAHNDTDKTTADTPE